MCSSHDDITYQSIAKAFNLPLLLHDEAYARMKKLSRPHPSQPNFDWEVESPAKKAKLRMVELPIDKSRDLAPQAIFPHEDLWVPVSVVNGNIHILPGVPRLFEKLLDGLKPGLVPRLTDPEGKGIHRILISTPMAESAVAPFLTELAAKVEPKGVKVSFRPSAYFVPTLTTVSTGWQLPKVGQGKEYRYISGTRPGIHGELSSRCREECGRP